MILLARGKKRQKRNGIVNNILYQILVIFLIKPFIISIAIIDYMFLKFFFPILKCDNYQFYFILLFLTVYTCLLESLVNVPMEPPLKEGYMNI